MDNRPEFISLALADWAETNQVELSFIQPGKPTQNAYIERFNKTYRHKVLNRYLFRNLNEVRQITESWVNEHNTQRPHEYLTPHEYLVFNNPQNST